MYSLVTKLQQNWKFKTSGELDKLNTSLLFETENIFGFPVVLTSPDFSCKDLIEFNLL